MEEIFKRVSVRQFTDQKVEEDKVTQLLKAAMQAPSAGNQQGWEFIVVKDKNTLSQLAQMSPYSKCISDAPLAIVVLGNEGRMKYPENWLQDLGAATQNMLLEITALELGGVWITAAPLEDRMKYVSDIFKLPSSVKPYCVVPVGYPKVHKEAKSRYDESKIHRETYSIS